MITTFIQSLQPYKRTIGWLLVIVVTNVFTFMCVTRGHLFEPGNEPLPTHVVFSKPAPNGRIVAMILHGSTGAILAGDRYYLALQHGETTYLITHELTQGQGNYEAGIEDIEWRNETEILIKRLLYDHQHDTVFHLDTHTWEEVVIPEESS
jgi:hypothetical protein